MIEFNRHRRDFLKTLLLGGIAGTGGGCLTNVSRKDSTSRDEFERSKLRQEPPKQRPLVYPWNLDKSENKGNISFNPEDYLGKEDTVIVNNKFFVFDNVRRSELSDVVSSTLFDLSIHRAYNLPTFDSLRQKKGYNNKVRINLKRLGSNGNCLYDLVDEAGQTIMAVVANPNKRIAHVFINRTPDFTWDFSGFWLSKDGTKERAVIEVGKQGNGKKYTEELVVFYGADNLNIQEREFGKLEAMSADKNVVIYRNDDTDSGGQVLTPHYFLFDETRIDFADCFKIKPGDEMTYKLSETGQSLVQRSHWNNGMIGLRVGTKIENEPDCPGERKSMRYKFSHWVEGIGKELGPITIHDNGSIDITGPNGQQTIPFSKLPHADYTITN